MPAFDATLEPLMEPTVDPTVRLRIATRIHFALLRHYGEDVAVSTLLSGEGDAREALWVCEASGHEDLVALAEQLNTAAREAARAVAKEAAKEKARAAHVAAHVAALTAAAKTAPQDLAWSQDTSGFGLSRLPEGAEPQAAKPARWLSPGRWLRGHAAR